MGAGDHSEPEQMRVLARLDPEAKLAVARQLLEDALLLKEAFLRDLHHDEDDDAIHRRLRAWRLHGRVRLD